MILVIVLSHKCKINPDNIATPIAASLGDLTTLTILASIGGFLFKIIGIINKTFFHKYLYFNDYLDNYTWLPIIITTFFLILIPIWVMITIRNEYVKDVLIHGWLTNFFFFNRNFFF